MLSGGGVRVPFVMDPFDHGAGASKLRPAA